MIPILGQETIKTPAGRLILPNEATRKALVNPDIDHMAEVAGNLQADAYSGGWVQMANYPYLGAPAQVNTFTTITAIVSPFPALYLPANSLSLGTKLRMHVWGVLQSAAGTATFTIVPTFGSTAGAGNGGTGTMGSTPAAAGGFGGSAGSQGFFANYEAVVTALGAAGTATVIGMGYAVGISTTIGAVSLIQGAAGITAPASLATVFSTTVPMALVPCSVCSASSGTNGFTAYGYSVEQLN